jgi:hypothetical protein
MSDWENGGMGSVETSVPILFNTGVLLAGGESEMRESHMTNM